MTSLTFHLRFDSSATLGPHFSIKHINSVHEPPDTTLLNILFLNLCYANLFSVNLKLLLWDLKRLKFSLNDLNMAGSTSSA